MADLTICFTSIRLSRAAEIAAVNAHGVCDISPHTVRWFHSAIVSLMNYLGDVEITAVSPRDIAAWQDHQIKRGVGEVTINSYLRALKTMFHRLQENRTIGHNPAHPIKPLPEPQPTAKAITEAHYRQMKTAAGTMTHPIRNTAVIDTLWATGCRAGELIGMDVQRLEQWAENGRFCAAIQVKGKLGKIRWVYWKGDQAESLIHWLAVRPPSRCAAVFTTEQHGRFTANSFSSLMRTIRAAADLQGDHTNPHAFRHAFAIRQLDAGYDLATVSQWLGHSSPEFTAKVYCVRTENELRKRYFSEP